MNALEEINPVYLAAGALIIGAALWVKMKGASGVGSSIGSGAVDLVTGVLSGAADSAKTAVNAGGTALFKAVSNDLTACQKAKNAGDTWGVMANCPLKDISLYLIP